MPIRRAVLMMRTAISPRLAIRILENFKGAPASQRPLAAYRQFIALARLTQRRRCGVCSSPATAGRDQAAMLIVYEHPLSPYAQKVKIALREKGVAFDVALPGGLGAGGAAGDFARANP